MLSVPNDPLAARRSARWRRVEGRGACVLALCAAVYGCTQPPALLLIFVGLALQVAVFARGAFRYARLLEERADLLERSARLQREGTDLREILRCLREGSRPYSR
jgi:hypothetical protein